MSTADTAKAIVNDPGMQKTIGIEVAKIVAKRLVVKTVTGVPGKIVAKGLVKIAPKLALKVATRLGIVGGKLAAKAAAKAGMGPVGWALMAFDVLTSVLDIWDPLGYGDKLSNEDLNQMKEDNEKIISDGMKKAVEDYNSKLSPEDEKAVYDENVSPDPIEIGEIDDDPDNVGILNEATRKKHQEYMDEYMKNNNLLYDVDIDSQEEELEKIEKELAGDLIEDVEEEEKNTNKKKNLKKIIIFGSVIFFVFIIFLLIILLS